MKPKYEIAVIGTAALMLIVPYLFWNRAPKFVRDFFTATSAPVNLAVFRIVLFTLVLFSFSMGNVAWFGSLPWPPVDPANPTAAVPTNIPSGYRWVNGADPVAGTSLSPPQNLRVTSP